MPVKITRTTEYLPDGVYAVLSYSGPIIGFVRGKDVMEANGKARMVYGSIRGVTSAITIHNAEVSR